MATQGDVLAQARAVLAPSKVNFVIFHDPCSDGFAAAFAAWKLLGNNAVYHPAKHGSVPPNVRGKNVALFDFAYPREIMQRLISQAAKLVVIDHHKTAQIDLADLVGTYAFFDMTRSGARLAWEYFHPDKPRPQLIDYIEDRDLWTWRLPDSREYTLGLDLVPFDFSQWERVISDSAFEQQLLVKGRAIAEYTATQVERTAKNASPRRFKAFPQYKVMLVNSSVNVSEIGNVLAQLADVGCVYRYDAKERKNCVSLRSNTDEVDVSAIAKHFGGGGHIRASGFLWQGDMEALFEEDLDADLESQMQRRVSEKKKKASAGKHNSTNSHKFSE